MNDAWHWWQQALEAPKEIGRTLPVSDGHPEQGFYRVRQKGQAWEPVAIWKDDGNWLALRNGKSVRAEDIWTWACRNPITADAYDRALAGGGWADDDPTVATALMGHNVGDKSEFELLTDEIESAKQGAEAYADIETEEQAGKAQSLRARMNELAGKADKIREELKKPHLEAGKAVDGQWMPLVKSAKAVADLLRKEIETFKTAQLLELRRLELERQRAEAEQLISGEEVIVPPPLPPIDATIKGNYGRGATVRARIVVTGIDDLHALVDHLNSTQHDILTATLTGLAQKEIDRGIQTVPGVTVEERAAVS